MGKILLINWLELVLEKKNHGHFIHDFFVRMVICISKKVPTAVLPAAFPLVSCLYKSPCPQIVYQ